jgi:hypothetical protein
MTNHWSDKLGRLDAEEMQIMRDHVKIGVRILEPIPCFRSSAHGCPTSRIVRWFQLPSRSGGGEYQFCMRAFLQLQIAMTRSFLIDPTEKAFPSDKQKSETQFDPTVIEVFERLAATGQLA